MASSYTYCTQRDVQDVFPNIDDYDMKSPIYGWIVSSGSLYVAHNSGNVTQLFVDGQDLGNAQSSLGVVNENNEWFYDSTNDCVYYYNNTSNPADLLMESGDDFSTMITRIMKNASRYVDSRIDGNLPRDQFKDKEGNFDYMIIRTTALCSAYFLINAQDPTNPLKEEFLDEVNFNIDQLNNGKSRLSGSVSGDASKGIVREVQAPQAANGLHIVDTRGHYIGIYDLLKVIVTTAGAIGTARYDVFAKDNTSLKINKIVDSEIINGDYQDLGSGIEIRFAGLNSSSVASVNDEWEIEVWGKQEAVDDNIGQIRSTKMSRSGLRYLGK